MTRFYQLMKFVGAYFVRIACRVWRIGNGLRRFVHAYLVGIKYRVRHAWKKFCYGVHYRIWMKWSLWRLPVQKRPLQNEIAHAVQLSKTNGKHDIDTRNTQYAVMWAQGINLGDDIQTLAAIHSLAKLGIHEYTFVERDTIRNYKGPPVTLVMNGWFMEVFGNFPPPDTITPIFISFHSTSKTFIRRYAAYFKKHEPIGCRDTVTMMMFEHYGIAAYFTGCMSLCFDRCEEERDNRAYIVDLHWPQPWDSFGKNYSAAAVQRLGYADADLSERDSIEYCYHNFDEKQRYSMKLEERLGHARRLLAVYRKAGIVITSRLHCALPCRALGTDVLFIHKDYKTDIRFSGLYDYIGGATECVRTKTVIASEVMTKAIDEKRQEIIDTLGYLLAKSSKSST